MTYDNYKYPVCDECYLDYMSMARAFQRKRYPGERLPTQQEWMKRCHAACEECMEVAECERDWADGQ